MSITLTWSTIVPFVLWAMCAVKIGAPSEYRGGYCGDIAGLFYAAGHLLNIMAWLLVLFAWKYFEMIL